MPQVGPEREAATGYSRPEPDAQPVRRKSAKSKRSFPKEKMTLLHRVSISVAALLICTTAISQEARLAKAEAIVDAFQAMDARQIVKFVAEDLVRQNGDYQFRAQYEEFLSDVAKSPEYRAAKASAYARVFTDDELDGILALAKNPVFQMYQERNAELQKESRLALASVLRPRAVEFARKIEVLKAAGTKR